MFTSTYPKVTRQVPDRDQVICPFACFPPSPESRLHPQKDLFCCAKFISDGVTALWSQDLRGRTVDEAAILHIETTDLEQVIIISAIGGQKLRHLRHGFRRVHCKSRSFAIE